MSTACAGTASSRAASTTSAVMGSMPDAESAPSMTAFRAFAPPAWRASSVASMATTRAHRARIMVRTCASSGYGSPRIDTLAGTSWWVLVMTRAPGEALCRNRSVSTGSNPRSTSAAPSEMMGPWTSPMRTVDSTTPPRWAIPCTSPTRTFRLARFAASPRNHEAERLPWPPTPTMKMSVRGIGPPHWRPATSRRTWTIASFGQIWAHTPHPMHSISSMCTSPSRL